MDGKLQRKTEKLEKQLGRLAKKSEQIHRAAEDVHHKTEEVHEKSRSARQNVASDPPFSNLDLISCRNVLIYLSPALQHKVLPVFHYALRPHGLLLLGASETVGTFAELFSLVDKKSKIFAKKVIQTRMAINFGHALPATSASDLTTSSNPEGSPTLGEVQKHADRIVLTSYSLPGVVINEQMEVLQFRGRTSPYLEHGHGEASLNILKMAREGLMIQLRAILERLAEEKCNFQDFEILENFPRKGRRKMRVIVRQLTIEGQPDPMILLSMQEAKET